MIKLMYITNNPEIAKMAENAGVDRIFVDLEYIGKDIRQGGMDTVQSHHKIEDIENIRKVITNVELLVRCNPIHEAGTEYGSSKVEIDAIVKAGADVIMLPYFKTVEEVKYFLDCVEGRVKTSLLVETPEAVEVIDEILTLEGVGEIHIGLNDLSLGYGKKFMFELLTDGTVEKLCQKIKQRNIPFGFGGIAGLGKGMLPAEYIIKEHYRLGSTCAILSRSFCNTNKIEQSDTIQTTFEEGVKEIRKFEKECEDTKQDFDENCRIIAEYVELICSEVEH